jgi:hypothetical protein
LKKLLIIAVFLLFSTILYNSASAQLSTFFMENATGMTVTSVYVSITGAGSWSENILSDSKVKNGDSFQFDLNINPNNCNYDVKFINTKGREYVAKNVSFCSSSFLTLKKP